MLRLKGRGLPGKGGPGDLLVRVQAQIPEYIDPLIIDAIRENGKNK
jgi:DnaJ-class molecular chaperone